MNREIAVKAVKEIRNEVAMFGGTGREVADLDGILHRVAYDKGSSPAKCVEEAMRIRDGVAVTH